MTALDLARALGAQRTGSTWMARCPAHDDREPSLAISDASDGKILVRCHAGCDQRSVISSLRARGLWTDAQSRPDTRRIRRTPDVRNGGPEDGTRIAAALAIWHSSKPAIGSLVETYLVSREHHFTGPRCASLSCGTEAPVGRPLAGNGGARVKGRGRNAYRHSSHFPCSRRRRQGTRRPAEDDAGAVPVWSGEARPASRSALGWRGH